jgi:hypothetical protein
MFDTLKQRQVLVLVIISVIFMNMFTFSKLFCVMSHKRQIEVAYRSLRRHRVLQYLSEFPSYHGS